MEARSRDLFLAKHTTAAFLTVLVWTPVFLLGANVLTGGIAETF